MEKLSQEKIIVKLKSQIIKSLKFKEEFEVKAKEIEKGIVSLNRQKWI